MLNKIADFIERQHLLRRDGLHLVALSGGADSVALLLILQRLGYRIEAMHCNFHLRGEESNRDEEFVKSFCSKNRVPLHLIHFDTREYAILHHVSIEMAARHLRYHYFEQLLHDLDADTVCVAHHRDDSVETVLMNLIRGTGIHGLTGIRPLNGHIVRPLLCVSRQEVEEYLHSIGQSFVIDSTNLVDDVVRNKIRLNLVPLLRQMNPKAVENIDKTANNIQQAEKMLNETTASSVQRLVRHRSSAVFRNHTYFTIDLTELLGQPAPEYLLNEILNEYGFHSAQILQAFESIQKKQSGKTFCSSGFTLLICHDMLVIEPVQRPLPAMRIPETGIYVYADQLKFSFETLVNAEVSTSADCATLDADKVKFPLTIRTAQPGDAFHPYGMKGKKLVSDFLADRKIHLLERRRQLVVTDCDGNIVWLACQRTDDNYKVTSATRKILRISLGCISHS